MNFYKYSVIFYIILAFILSALLRMYWVFWASAYPDFFWNDILMINTNDGYAFAEGARDMLAGFHQENDLSYYGNPLSTLTFWIVKFLHIKLEFAMLYMSVFFGSLVVIPIFLITKKFSSSFPAFMAAVIAATANSYYNRTMVGYYDTDMLIITLTMFMLWAILNKKILWAPIFITIYMWWYVSAFSLISFSILSFLVYTFIFDRKNLNSYLMLALMILAISNLEVYLKFILIFSVYFIYKKINLNYKNLAFLFFVCLGIFVFKGGLNPIIFSFKFYVLRHIEQYDAGFVFLNVNKTIQEASLIPFDFFAQRISGSIGIFILSLFGILVLFFKNKQTLILLPSLILGFLALKGGLRFTIYAVPIMAIGFGFMIYNMSNFFKKFKNIFYFICFAVAFYPIGNHIYHYRPSSVFSTNEVKVLSDLKKIAKRQDYVLTWWDYGYPVRFYGDVKTLIDGGKHLGSDNFAVSYALSKDLSKSSKMAKLEVEYTERNFKEKFGLNLKQMMRDYNKSSVDDFLNSLNDIKLTKQNFDIYYYLPARMLDIFSVVSQFSNINLNNAEEYKSFYFASEILGATKDRIYLSESISLSKDVKSLFFDNSKININTFFEVKDDGSIERQIFDKNSNIYAIYMDTNHKMLIMDKDCLNSTFIQLFVFENYKNTDFEPVILNPEVKIYKLKNE